MTINVKTSLASIANVITPRPNLFFTLANIPVRSKTIDKKLELNENFRLILELLRIPWKSEAVCNIKMYHGMGQSCLSSIESAQHIKLRWVRARSITILLKTKCINIAATMSGLFCDMYSFRSHPSGLSILLLNAQVFLRWRNGNASSQVERGLSNHRSVVLAN